MILALGIDVLEALLIVLQGRQRADQIIWTKTRSLIWFIVGWRNVITCGERQCQNDGEYFHDAFLRILADLASLRT